MTDLPDKSLLCLSIQRFSVLHGALTLRNSNMKRPYLTVSVYHLQPTVTAADVHSFFERYAPGSDPAIGPFVSKDDRYWATTVTFKGKSRAACEDAVAKLNGQLYLDASLNESQIGVSHTFHGITPLYESSKAPAAFEYVFGSRN